MPVTPCPASEAMSSARKGRSPMGASGLGTSETADLSRVPNPPARMMACIALSALPLGAVFLAEHRILDDLAQDMAEHDMAFLNIRRMGRRNFQRNVAERRHL